MALGLASLLLAHAVGFALPGLFAAKALRVRPIWCGAFALSWLSLVLGVIALQIAGLPLHFWSVLFWQLGVAGLAALAWRADRGAEPPEPAGERPGFSPAQLRLLLGLIGAAALVLLWRLWLVPLAGYDTPFRWEFLARKILEHANLDYYPPASAADYRIYFFPDAIPPVVSAPYWWLYAAWGRPEPRLTTLFVMAQWSATLGFTHRAASNLGGRDAGWLAAALLAGSAFFFRSVAIGQDAGATALAVAGALAVWTERRGLDARGAVAAALLCGVGAMVREYGAAVAVIAATPLFWPRRRWRLLALYGAVLAALAAPWVLRNLVRLGHPFHSLPLPLFAPLSPVYAEILRMAQLENAPLRQPWTVWSSTLIELARSQPILLPLGPAAALLLARRVPFLLVSLALALALWTQAIALSHGGMLYSTRVLAPAAVISALAVAVVAADRARRPAQRRAVCALLGALALWGLLLAASFPFNLGPTQLGPALPTLLQHHEMPLAERELAAFAQRSLPRAARILSENAFAHALLQPLGFDVVPIWSPEVAFVFDASTPAREVRRKLDERGIRYLLFYPNRPNTRYCVRHPFYNQDLANWRPIARDPGVYVLLEMPE